MRKVILKKTKTIKIKINAKIDKEVKLNKKDAEKAKRENKVNNLIVGKKAKNSGVEIFLNKIVENDIKDKMLLNNSKKHLQQNYLKSIKRDDVKVVIT